MKDKTELEDDIKYNLTNIKSLADALTNINYEEIHTDTIPALSYQLYEYVLKLDEDMKQVVDILRGLENAE